MGPAMRMEDEDVSAIEDPSSTPVERSIEPLADIAPTEQWYVKFDMHHGLKMFTTEGTLLDVAREPILQWVLSNPVKIETLLSHVINTMVAKSPCANDVAIIGLTFDDTVLGVYMGFSWSGFTTRDTFWNNFTDSICAVLDYECSELSLLNVILTNTRIVLLTTLGLFISEDLRYGNFHELKFFKPNFCGFEMDDYFRAKIWYNIQCLANQENYEVDYIAISFTKDKTLSQESTCFYSNDPFKEWYSCLDRKKQNEKLISRRAVSFLIDYQQNTGVGLLTQQNKALVSVKKLTGHKLHRRRKFPNFWFPDTQFEASGMFFHPNSHFLYVYGNQVWLSEDGGNGFQLLIKLTYETVIKTDTCVHNQAIIFVTDKGSVFYAKAGVHRYAKLTGSIDHDVFNMNFDHLGDLFCITLNDTVKDALEVKKMDVNTLLQVYYTFDVLMLNEDDLSFDGALSPQYVTEEQIIFFSHIPLGPYDNDTIPRFYNLYIGKALEYGMGGSGIINQVFEHNKYPPNFISSIIVDVLDRFPVETSISSPCVLNTLTILQPDPGTTAFKLQLGASDSNIFQVSDIEKTVVIPGFSSFLITDVVDDLTALADATMPYRVPINIVFISRQWFLYDFGTTNGRKWRVIVDRCRYTIQQLDDLPVHAIKYLDLGSKMNFSFRVTPVNVAFQVFQMDLMEVIVGRPSLLDVITEDYWDDTDSYILKIMVQSKFFEQVNYRPPSILGIAVPLTENFYNADPAKPRMRDYFQGSKSSGTYKQCANKKSRSECGCTDNMKLSFFVAFSDCKEKEFPSSIEFKRSIPVSVSVAT
ncbi:cation channel sperm-associated auxiliary subunit beta [Eublepharis macularius]|uniref:Cation channel sperm-associated auxiliary subunit beta n=1 Tax=Eublepharis macularius TaxID=481883 RepID=A0AA97IZZ7_EUBMA|nr:cation channel sperm-associated auxiliary subunit beta [Eublepharis macularius]